LLATFQNQSVFIINDNLKSYNSTEKELLGKYKGGGKMVKSSHKPAQTMNKVNANKVNEWRMITLLKANIIAYMITAIAFIGSALLLTYTSLPESSIPAIAIVTTIISVLVAGYDTAKGAPSKGWLWGLSAGLVYAVILIIISSTVDQKFMVSRNTATFLIMAGAGGTLGGMIGINVKK